MRASKMLWIFLVLLAFAGAGWRPLWEPDEGRYAECAREMAVSGNWIVPTLQGEQHLTKPPFTYWVTAAGLKTFGINEWGARLPLGAFYLGVVLCVGALARTWGRSEAESQAAMLIYATGALTFACGHILTTDTILTFWETLGVLAAWRAWTRAPDAPHAEAWRIIFWAAFGFAFLTKGPPGWMPMLPLLLYFLGMFVIRFKRGRWPVPGRLFSLTGVVVFLVVSLTWYLVLTRYVPGVLGYFWHDEIVGRYTTNEHHRDQPFWLYFLYLPLGVTPWLFLWPTFVRKAWGRISAGLSGPQLFSLLWVTIMLTIFCLAKSRLIFYVVPLFPPLCVWLGVALMKPRGGGAWLRSHEGVAHALAALWIGVLITILIYPDHGKISNSDRQFALDLKAIVAAKPTRIVSDSDPQLHSISFYSGLRLIDDGLPTQATAQTLMRHAAVTGEQSILITRTDHVEDLDRYTGGLTYRVLAHDARFAAVQINPSSGTLARAPKGNPSNNVDKSWSASAQKVPAKTGAKSAQPN